MIPFCTERSNFPRFRSNQFSTIRRKLDQEATENESLICYLLMVGQLPFGLGF